MYTKEKIAQLVKDGRTTMGYTQQQVSDLCGISLRSVQRIENGEVLPRLYTLKILSQQLGFEFNPGEITQDTPSSADDRSIKRTTALPRKIILSICAALVLFVGMSAFISQSARFPQTTFEYLLLWGGTSLAFMMALYLIWK